MDRRRFRRLLLRPRVSGNSGPPQEALSLLLKDAGKFEDAARTVPATDEDDIVNGWADRSGHGNHAAVGEEFPGFTLKLAFQNGRQALVTSEVDSSFLIIPNSSGELWSGSAGGKCS